MAGQPARVVRIQVGNFGNGKFPKALWLLLVIPFVIVIFVVLAVLGVLAPTFYSVGRAIKESDRTTGGGTVSKKEADNSFATKALDFGSEGIGPGMFNDGRSIAVDATGRIYVGEYTGGRIQVFDADGKFVTQWSIGDRKTLLRGFAADRKGNVYAVHNGIIERYKGETGEKLGQLEYDKTGFDDVTISADGGLVTVSHNNRDDIVKFDANGKVTQTIPAAISSASGDSELSMRVAVDGAGYTYALGHFNNGVFKFTSDGKFMTRFGDAGDKPGQFRAPLSIAVDGYGRVYVGDMKGIQVFDSSGRYIALIKLKGAPFGMTFNDKNELFVIARDHVVKFAVPAP
jgi:sugar lactone lactonase YvrE